MYTIRKAELPRTRDGNVSEWIMQLMPKKWVDKETLYQLASIIKREYPTNSIDWHRTFFVVEKAAYLDSLAKVLIPKEASIVDRFYAKIDLGMKESTPETDKLIDQEVARSLNMSIR